MSMTSTASAMLWKVLCITVGRVPQFLMGGDQMLGALGDRGFERLVGGLGCSERIRSSRRDLPVDA